MLSAILAACSSGPLQPGPVGTPPEQFSSLKSHGDHYLAQAKRAEPTDAFSWRVLAIRAFLEEQQLAKAQQLLAQLQKDVSPEQAPTLDLLTSALSLARGQVVEAEQQLAKVNQGALSRDAKSYYFWLQAKRLEQQQQPIDAAAMLVKRHELLSASEQSSNRERIYALLADSSAANLRQAQQSSDNKQFTGWLRLMAILNASGTDQEQRQWQLQSWQRTFPEHPGSYYLPEGIANAAVRLAAYQPRHIAVLLPLTGKLSEQADAIRNGILSAHQGQSSRVSFFDTTKQSMTDIYQQLQNSEVDFIIGPLLKDKLTELANLDIALPVLALNMPNQAQHDLAHRYYFSLAPDAEAAEAARHMWEQGHQQPLVFAPNNALGKRMAHGFNQQWQQQTGQKARIAYFNSKQSIENDVRRALNTKASAPSAKAGEIQPISELENTPKSGSIDSVFMASNATETRFILPYFDFVRDSRAQRLPTYVTSRSYTEDNEAPMSELNQLQLADMPWLFGSAPQLKEEVALLWPDRNASWLRLFALGYDALTLVPQLTDLQMGSPAVAGLTGELTVSEQGVVQRQLQWMEYRDGTWQAQINDTIPWQ